MDVTEDVEPVSGNPNPEGGASSGNQSDGIYADRKCYAVPACLYAFLWLKMGNMTCLLLHGR